MKLLPMALASLACLWAVSGAKSAKSVSAIDEEVAPPEAQRKRDAGYSYARPPTGRYSSAHPGERLYARIVAKGPGVEASRPFTRYGPPRQQPGAFKQAFKPNLHIFLEDSSRNSPQGVPSPSREYEFAEASPIAGQNNLPFNSNFANYLPPRNQKLPGHASAPYSFADERRPSKLQHHLAADQQSQISDAAAFLAENSRAISQLYEAPATSINYEPSNEEANDKAINFNDDPANFKPIESFPSYASGYVDRDDLRSIKSLEKDRLIKQLRHELVDARGKNSGRLESSDFGNDNNDNFENRGKIFGQNGRQYGSKARPSTSGYVYEVPATPSTVPSSTVASTLVTAPANQRPQATGSPPTGQTGNALPQPATSVQFPQFAGGFVPSLVPNYFAGYPLAPIPAVVASGSTNVGNVHTSAPTHFGIPIPSLPPTMPKPDSTISQNPQNPINSIPLQPLNPMPTTPIHAFPLLPAAVTPVHEVQNPATNFIGHPSYGVQSTNHLHVKPIKTIYPLYYYQNIYQFQKPGLATLPWNYAPSYSQAIRPEQGWK